jgi:hypothetical protein
VAASAGRAAAEAEAGPNYAAAAAAAVHFRLGVQPVEVQLVVEAEATDLPTVAAGLAAVEDEEALRRSSLPECLPA